jgi:CubicO group peptidase (beta-lactamase class C family)
MIVTEWQARHGLTPQQHQTEFNKLVGLGFRPSKITGYAIGGQPRYASIWVKQGGNDWQARHGLSAAQYQQAIEQLGAQGFRPIDLSIVRAGGQTLFSAIWERESGLEWVARHALTSEEYQTLFTQFIGQGFRLRCMSSYDNGGGERFACIWDRYAGPAWSARHGLSAAQYQQEFDKQQQLGFRLVRTVGYTVGGQTHYAGTWEKSPGHAFQAGHRVAHNDFQSEFDRLTRAGLRLVDVSGFADGNSARYSTIWEATPEADFSDAANRIVVPFMQKWAVPGLSLATARAGVIRTARTFGYANRITREIVTPDHRFRIASVTKPITSTAIHLLIQQNKLRVTDKVFGPGALLGTTFGTKPYSARLKAITVQHLLEHSAGGWSNNDGNDPMFLQTGLSQAALISWTLDNQPQVADPGTQYAYSNFGYCLLGRIIEKVTSQTYASFVNQAVLNPSGATRMALAGSNATQRADMEAMYFAFNDNAYGMRIDRMDSHGGWIAHPTDILRFRFRVDGLASPPDLLTAALRTAMTTPSAVKPPTTMDAGYARGWSVTTEGVIFHDGLLPGTQSILVNPKDGRAWAAVCSTGRPRTNLAFDFDQMLWQVQAALPLAEGGLADAESDSAYPSSAADGHAMMSPDSQVEPPVRA